MPDRPANPPTTMAHMASKMPPSSHALFVVIDGKVENPEFVVWGLDDYREELWKWKRKGVTTQGRAIEFWAKHGRHFYRTNPRAV